MDLGDAAGVNDALSNVDGDADIDLSDYNWLAANFNPGGYGTTAVPEPVSLAICMMGLIGVTVASPWFQRCGSRGTSTPSERLR